MKTQPTAARPPATPRRAQFGLRSLLWAMAGLSSLFALLNLISPAAAWLLVWMLCLVALHISAAAISVWMRSVSNREADGNGAEASSAEFAVDAEGRRIASPVNPAHPRHRPAMAASAAPRTPHHLRQRSPLGFVVLLITIIGAISGGSVGGVALAGEANVATAGLVVGGLSSAVLGGFAGFLGGTFLAMSISALQEALREHR